MSDHSRSAWWNALVLLASCVGVLLAVYSSTVGSLIDSWARDPFGHGYFVFPVAAYLAWTRRTAVAALTPRSTFWAIPALALFGFVWLLGQLTATDIVQQFCLVAMLIAVVWGVLGSGIAGALAFPLAFLFFSVPVAERFLPVLQQFTAQFAVVLVRLIDVPALLEGHVISIPGSSWLVAEACSGINYLVSSLAIGYIYAGIAYRRWVPRIGFVAAAAVLALLANGLRVCTTILIASAGATEVAAGLGHDMWGIVVFGIIMAVLMATCGNWTEKPGPEVALPAHHSPAPISTLRRSAAVALVTILVLAAPPISAASRGLAGATTGGRDLMVRVSAPWTESASSIRNILPKFASATQVTSRTYRTEASEVALHLGLYLADDKGAELAAAHSVVIEGPWVVSEVGRSTVPMGDQPVGVRETIMHAGAVTIRMWRWYGVADAYTSNDYYAKLMWAKARLLGDSRPAFVAIAFAEEKPGRPAAETLANFVRNLSLSWP